MSLIALIPILAAANLPGEPSNIKRNEIDLMYTFSKVSVKGLPMSTTIYTNATDALNYNEKTINITYGWGNQGTFIYNRLLNDPKYCFSSAFTYLHAGNTYHKLIPIGSAESFGTDAAYGALPQYKYQRDQINYYQLDLFMKAKLHESNHVIFSVWGGLITSWFQVSEKRRGGYDINQGNQIFRRDYFSSNVYKNYYLGPNLKIDLKSPFFKNHFYVGLKAGIGLMMNFRTSLFSDAEKDYNYTSGKIDFRQGKDNLHNKYMFCPQADLEASLGYTVNHFKLEVGLNQFLFITNLLENRFGTLTYGGPYIKAGYEF